MKSWAWDWERGYQSTTAVLTRFNGSLIVLSALEHLILYMEKVAEAAPRLPLFYYHIPAMTGVTCQCSLYNQLCCLIILFMSTWRLIILLSSS